MIDLKLTTPEIGLLLGIAREKADGYSVAVDREKFIALVQEHELGPLAYSRLSAYPWLAAKSSDLLETLKPVYLETLAKNTLFLNEFLKISAACGSCGINIAPLKGVWMLARYFPDFQPRPMADIDLLVKPQDFEKTRELFLQMGYREHLGGLRRHYWREKHFHLAFVREACFVELHWALDYPQSGARSLVRAWERARDTILSGQPVTLLSDEDAFLNLILHVRRFGNIFSLKQVMDAARIVRCAKDFDWEYVGTQVARFKVRASFVFVAEQLRLFSAAVVPQDVLGKITPGKGRQEKIASLAWEGALCRRKPLREKFLAAHFLLRDTFPEAVWEILTIAYEPFCKFYRFRRYSFRSKVCYWLRVLYIPFSALTLRR